MMKDMKGYEGEVEEAEVAGMGASNRGTSGQCLFDSTNPPGDNGKPGAGCDVNLDPKSRKDEGY